MANTKWLVDPNEFLLFLFMIGFYATAFGLYYIYFIDATDLSQVIPHWKICTIIVLCGACGACLGHDVSHEAHHEVFSRSNFINQIAGRIAMYCFMGHTAFSAYNTVHGIHHLHTNDPELDIQTWNSDGPIWTLPLRWLTCDMYYGYRYWKLVWKSKKVTPIQLFDLLCIVAIKATLMPRIWHPAVMLLHWIPTRLGLLRLGLLLEYLPHHNLSTKKFQDTRLWLENNWLLRKFSEISSMYHCYHLVHHVYPAVPFYKLYSIWLKHKNHLINDHNVAIFSIFGEKPHVR